MTFAVGAQIKTALATLRKLKRFKRLIFFNKNIYQFSEECSTKGGVAAGGCAEGFGVCCTCKKKITIF